MESDPTPANPNREGASNMEEDMSTSEHVYRPNNQLPMTYHRRYPGGEYVRVLLSSGYRFHPHDDELIEDYLKKKMNGEEAPCIHFPTVNVYEHSPKELAESHQSVEKDEWYFFSPRERKYMNGTRPSRSAGNGYWKATGADKKINDQNGECIGSRKCLVFYEGKAPKGKKTNWIMIEYVAGHQPPRRPGGPGDMRLDDCVLCRIYKKSGCSPKREKQTAAASESSKTKKSASHKSSENKNQVTPELAKTEHAGTKQQVDLPVRHNLPVLQQYPTMQQQNGQVLQPNLPTPPQQIGQTSPQQQNIQAIQCSLKAGSHNLGGQLQYPLTSIPQDTKQIHSDNLENSIEPFRDWIHLDMDRNPAYTSVYHNMFGHLGFPGQNFDYINRYSSLDCFDMDSLFNNNDHPPDGH